VGLAARLQGWSDVGPLLKSPQAGFLFETLVLAEIVKIRDHLQKSWDIHFWRTKDGEEVDFLVTDGSGKTVVLDAKLAVQAVEPRSLPPSLVKTLPNIEKLAVVTFGGEQRVLSRTCMQVPIRCLHDYLLETLS
jgi:predicted AAA+ superfamily ATPase